MSSALRILLSGPGLIGSAHASRIKERDDCVVAAVVVPEVDEYRPFAASIDARIYPTIESALAEEIFDGAIISSPNQYHHPQALACIAAGIPVLVEKPLTDKLDTARAIVRASENSGVPVLVGHHRTYSPLLEQARELVQGPDFGRLVVVQGSALFYKPADYFLAGPWRSQPGGGPGLINLIHEIGMLRYLCGEIASVQAFISNSVRSFPVEDTIAISLRFLNGCLGTFILSDAAASSKSWEMTSGENQIYPFYGDEYSYHLAGTNASLDFPSMKVRSYASGASPSWWRPFEMRSMSTNRTDPLRNQIEHFVNMIRGLEKPRVSAHDGYRNLLVLDAIFRAASEQRSIELEY